MLIKKQMQYYAATFFMLLSGLGFSLSVNAQEIKGIVHELESSERLQEVTVKNLRTDEVTHTDSEGNFTIGGAIDDLLSFNQAGYETDTAFVYEEGIQRIYLIRDSKTIVIDEVVISRLTDSRLAYEIEKAKNEGQVAEASQTRGGLRVSLSRIFGREGKMARSNLDILLTEQDNRKVDQVFTAQVIRDVVPLTASEMALFREQFRPTPDFIETASPEDIRAYILDSYATFRAQQ